MAQLYVTGPVHVYIKHVLDGTVRFLGHGERAPTIQLTPNLVPVKCDVGGEAQFESIYSGEGATVRVDLVRYNMAVMNTIRVRSRSTAFPAAVPGYDNPGMIGTLTLAEGAYYQLILVFPNAAKPFYQNAVNGALPAGYRFKAAVMDPESQQPGSANPYKLSVSWTCLRIFDPTDRNAFGFGGFSLYDNNVAEALAVPLN